MWEHLTILFIKARCWLIRKLGGRPNKKLYGRIIYTDINQGERIDREMCQNLSKSDLIDILCAEQTPSNWCHRYCILEREYERLRRVLKAKFGDALNFHIHMSDLEEKNSRLKQEINNMRLKAEWFNNTLYATGLIVRCTGCWPGRPDNAEELTEERVENVENIARRLRSWWNNNKIRIK